jgi:hypothetical protein
VLFDNCNVFSASTSVLPFVVSVRITAAGIIALGAKDHEHLARAEDQTLSQPAGRKRPVKSKSRPKNIK